VRLDGNPGMDVWLTQRDGDHQVWELDAVGSFRAAKHPATFFARLAVAADGTLWAVATSGTLWRRVPSGQWLQANAIVGETITAPLEDVTVASDGTVWLAAQDGTLWTTTDGSVLVERTVILPFKRLSGGPGPPDGMIWGLTFGGDLFRFNGTWWDALDQNHNYLDVSVTFEGLIWLVRDDGMVTTTHDGANFADRPGESGFENVSAGRYGISWATKSDGSLFVWHPIPVGETTPPGRTTPPPAPPPPAISVSVEGEHVNTVYVVSGSRFTPNSDVAVRVTRFERGTFHDVRFSTRSDERGEIFVQLHIPCLSGLAFHFTATDGRLNPGDLTEFLWSNAVERTCP
jgi:hypothetical protein